jgi:uridine kinase
MKEIFNKDDLLLELRERFLDCKSIIITIDGRDGVGKTYIGKQIAKKLPFHLIQLDKYLFEEQGAFIDYLNYKRLEQRIRQLLETSLSIIIEGVCVLEVLKRINIQSDCRIYVRSYWKLFHYNEEANTAKERIELEEQKIKEFAKVEAAIEQKPFIESEFHLSGLECDIINYHFEHFPDKNADILLNNSYEKN